MITDEEIKKASACCVKGDCFRCPLDCIHNCRTALREGMNDILYKQQLELVLKRNTIHDLKNQLTEKQSENEKLQSLCTSKDVIIQEQQERIEELEIITGLANNRKYYRKFVDEVFCKQKGRELSEPDFDYIYQLYFEQQAEIEKLKNTQIKNS